MLECVRHVQRSRGAERDTRGRVETLVDDTDTTGDMRAGVQWYVVRIYDVQSAHQLTSLCGAEVDRRSRGHVLHGVERSELHGSKYGLTTIGR